MEVTEDELKEVIGGRGLEYLKSENLPEPVEGWFRGTEMVARIIEHPDGLKTCEVFVDLDRWDSDLAGVLSVLEEE